MNYATIKWYDIANGEGVRISLFVSGCTHRCKNCFNQVAWDFSYGESFDEGIQAKILKELESPFISGLSLLGGEPFEPANQEALLPFLQEVKRRFPEKTIWCYTGCVFDVETGLFKDSRWNSDCTKELVSLLDVLIDGPYVEELHNIRLKFRGSSNQRVIDVKKTLSSKTCVLYME
jgi:anaerobic ribonucleoside-triphosphate reductase activating protein